MVPNPAAELSKVSLPEFGGGLRFLLVGIGWHASSDI
jgi:hypothetical protein